MPPQPGAATRNDRPARERILDATLAVVATAGVDAVTHRAVAARAGVSPGSTTHHFTSREDLLRAAFRHYMTEAEAVAGALLGAPPPDATDPLGWVEDQLVALLDREFSDTDLVRAEYELLLFASTDPELRPDVRAWEARLVGLVAPGLERAGIERPLATGRIVVNLVRGFELQRLLDPDLRADAFRAHLAPLLDGLRRADR